MAACRNDSWKDDMFRKEEMFKYVKHSLQREEILDFLTRDFTQYAWSLRTLDRRLRYFGILFEIPLNESNVCLKSGTCSSVEQDGPCSPARTSHTTLLLTVDEKYFSQTSLMFASAVQSSYSTNGTNSLAPILLNLE